MNIIRRMGKLNLANPAFLNSGPFRKSLFLPRGCLCPRLASAGLGQTEGAPTMPARRDAIVAAVAAHNRAHKPLPHSAVRLLEAMFAGDDVCQQSVEALEEVAGLSRKSVQKGLRALLTAAIIAKDDTGAGRHANRYRLLQTTGCGA
jgi:hypothetical protein